ncbi:hypothetical protein DMH12_24860 [Streptomyces sp. WAC 04229]|uniref:hypothetical protein n=1 Tax=Streptomyces sp. WAC 04229 TaxID=2203206 RepID=UPI000F741509|nr:hypothetical protein [Streptomyces sp. WAC 04229]RSN50516.1 hypothetical protein DMH12_24860 [Streptomyces sp. WAC 04229]
MTTLAFEPAEPSDDNPDYDDTACQCPPGDKNYLLEIDEGQAVLVHAACGKPPSYTWGDWQEFTVMDPIPVTVEWETDCDGNRWHGLNPCDCDHWVRVTATSVPEDVRAQALELTRKHAADRQHVAPGEPDNGAA